MTEAGRDAMEAAGKRMKQVQQHSGRIYHFSLDENTFNQLDETATKLKEFSIPVSLSVLVRRAIRLYARAIDMIQNDDSRKIVEGFELLKASKGTM